MPETPAQRDASRRHISTRRTTCCSGRACHCACGSWVGALSRHCPDAPPRPPTPRMLGRATCRAQCRIPASLRTSSPTGCRPWRSSRCCVVRSPRSSRPGHADTPVGSRCRTPSSIWSSRMARSSPRAAPAASTGSACCCRPAKRRRCGRSGCACSTWHRCGSAPTPWSPSATATSARPGAPRPGCGLQRRPPRLWPRRWRRTTPSRSSSWHARRTCRPTRASLRTGAMPKACTRCASRCAACARCYPCSAAISPRLPWRRWPARQGGRQASWVRRAAGTSSCRTP